MNNSFKYNWNKKKHNRVTDQKEVDAKLINQVKNTPALKHYLGARFSLTQGQYPHDIKF